MRLVVAKSQELIGNTLYVRYSNGIVRTYDAVKLGCEWFQMSNDAFFDTYGFNFVPRGRLYDYCRKKVYGNG